MTDPRGEGILIIWIWSFHKIFNGPKHSSILQRMYRYIYWKWKKEKEEQEENKEEKEEHEKKEEEKTDNTNESHFQKPSTLHFYT